MNREIIINNPLNVDEESFFRAFYDEGETLFLRKFHDKDKSNAPKNIAVKLNQYHMIKDELHQDNLQGYGVFLVINGGGQTDKEVKEAKAQFMEIDDLPMQEQLEIINSFPLCPSIVVRTKKSLHCYWLLKNGKIKKFRQLQERLISYFNSDKSIKNESRVMRVPNFYHNKKEPIKVEVIHFEPNLFYTQEELGAELPELPTKGRGKVSHTKDKKQNHDDTSQKIKSERVNTLVSHIGTYKTKGLPNHIIKDTIEKENAFMCEPPLTDIELEREVFPAIERFTNEPLKQPNYNAELVSRLYAICPEIRYKWNDKGNGEMYADLFKDCLRWNVTAKEWYHYDGKIWREDTDGMCASQYAKELVDALMIYSTQISDDKQKGDYQKHIGKLGQIKFRRTMLDDAKDKYYISAEQLDNNLYLLNLQNCVLDLKSFRTLEHNPDLLLSKICNVCKLQHQNA